MNKYVVTIVLMNGRKNTLVVWEDNEEASIKIALRWWGSPTIYKSVSAVKEIMR